MTVPPFIARAIKAQGRTTVEEVERRMELDAKREEQDKRWRESQFPPPAPPPASTPSSTPAPTPTLPSLNEIPGRESSGRDRRTDSSGDAR